MALLFHVIKMKQVLFSKLTCCVYQVIFLCMKCPVKRRVLFYKDMLEKHCAVVKIKLVTWKIFIERIMSHNAKCYIKSLKRNKVKSCEISGLWKKKNYSEENILLMHWQILQLLILAVLFHQVSQKNDNIIEVDKLIDCLFSFCSILKFC